MVVLTGRFRLGPHRIPPENATTDGTIEPDVKPEHSKPTSWPSIGRKKPRQEPHYNTCLNSFLHDGYVSRKGQPARRPGNVRTGSHDDAWTEMVNDGSNPDRLSVLMAPDYRGSNPYQTQLVSGLAEHDVSVNGVEVSGLAPILAGCRRYGVPDILHLHWIHTFIDTDRTALRALLGIRLLVEIAIVRLLGAEVVWTVHNVTEHENRSPRTERVLRHVVARTTKRIIVHCDAAIPIIRDAYRLPPETIEKIRVVPHGNYVGCYPNQLSKAEARAELDIPSDAVVFLYFGIIRRYKNVPRLIETFRSLEIDDGRLLVVGNPWSDELEADVVAARGTDRRIRTVLEYVPDEQVQLYMNAADAVVLPFESVLTSGSALLGMSFGRALVVPDIGCVGSLVSDRGAIAYDPSDSNAVESALREAFRRRDELPSMGRHNRAVAERYDWSSIAARTRDVYEGDTGGTSRFEADTDGIASAEQKTR